MRFPSLLSSMTGVSITTWLVVALLCQFSLATPVPQNEQQFEKMRRQMVEIAVKGAGVKDERVIRSMLATPRHEFVPRKIRRSQSYLDAGVPIGESQTISSPFIVAYMTQELDPQPTDVVLEIGTGSGYQAAILSPLVKEVYSIEIVERLGKTAAKVLKKLKYKNVLTKIGDGYKGWAEHAPFDKIIVTCSPEDIPQPLIDQLKEGGTIIVPMGERHQQTLYLMEKKDGKMVRRALRPTLFVPMTGAAEVKRRVLPDPANPSLLNGDFEEGLDENGFAKGWYYQRQLTLEQSDQSPSGKHFVQFKNSVPGQLAQVMQGFSIDGREVSVVKFSVSFACENVVLGPRPKDLPVAAISFYDAERQELGMHLLGPYRGTNSWLTQSRNIRVPHSAREGIVRIGMFGSTGTAKFDNLSVKAVKKNL
ncbi:MAG: protein-L-isoaspartate(D-aspartate) O-methyltransferase [Mariniblastus sp.]|nr:protein-L-isoaspartate(D-aspartate) O-methyltransferase [Mariniblastus sp.]